MRILLFTEQDGTEHILTTESPASHYGIPAYRIEDVEGSDYGPSDFIVFSGLQLLAGGVVAFWARLEDRTEQEIDAAKRFCAQDPNGPQVD